MEDNIAAVEAIWQYRNDPIGFAHDMDGVDLDSWQEDVLTALRDDRFVAMRSGSGVGKTFLLSLATRWFLFTHHEARVPTTAPSQHQLYDILWAEHFKWIDRSAIQRRFFTWTQTKLSVRGHEPSWFAVARTAQIKPGSDVSEGLSGFHDAKNLLFILDEASGIPDQVFAAVQGSLTTEGVYILLASNPTRRSGFFYDIFNNPKLGKFFHKFHISSEDSPRVTQSYVDLMEAKYGRDHPVFKIKVLGDFPDADEESLVPPDFIETMVNNSKLNCSAFPTEFGVDIGRSGAAAVLCVRQGFNILKWDERTKQNRVTDTMELIQWIVEAIQEFNPTHVKVDPIGLGAGVYDGLKLIYGNMIVPVIGNASSFDPPPSPGVGKKDDKAKPSDIYLNLRAQGYWNLRDMIPKIHSDTWPDRVIAELGSIKSERTTSGKVKIESKEKMLQRAMRSPDYADAMYMAFLSPEYCLGTAPIKFTFVSAIARINNELVKPNGSLWAQMNRGPAHNRWGRLYG